MSKSMCDMCWILGETITYNDDILCNNCIEKLKKYNRRGSKFEGAQEYDDI